MLFKCKKMSLIALIFKREGINEITYLDQNDDLNFLFFVMRYFSNLKPKNIQKQEWNFDSMTKARI